VTGVTKVYVLEEGSCYESRAKMMMMNLFVFVNLEETTRGRRSFSTVEVSSECTLFIIAWRYLLDRHKPVGQNYLLQHYVVAHSDHYPHWILGKWKDYSHSESDPPTTPDIQARTLEERIW